MPIASLFEDGVDENILYDEWGIYFSELDIAKTDEMSCLKGDLILCIANPTEGFFASLFGKDTNDKYEYHKEVFIDMVNYKK